MPRGITPRQPAKTGRHEGARRAAASKKPGALRTSPTGEGARPTRLVLPPCQSARQAYNPTAPDRVQDILQRLTPSTRRHLRFAPQERMELLVATSSPPSPPTFG